MYTYDLSPEIGPLHGSQPVLLRRKPNGIIFEEVDISLKRRKQESAQAVSYSYRSSFDRVQSGRRMAIAQVCAAC